MTRWRPQAQQQRFVVLVCDGRRYETPKALLLKFDERVYWLPKSQVEKVGDTWEAVRMPEWLMLERGLDPYFSYYEDEASSQPSAWDPKPKKKRWGQWS